jgi:electron transport complex protein RnfB
VFSNYLARVDSDNCTGCEDCLDRCQMNAIRMNGDDRAEVNPDRCIGCGLCVPTCQADAMKLVLKPEDRRRIPPASMGEQMMLMAQKRGVI